MFRSNAVLKFPNYWRRFHAVKSKSATTAFIIIDKPIGMTSHDVVNRVRKIAGLKQVGHGGTLDPMATGVMVVALGKACRLLRFLADDKTYLATIKLGTVTDTDDVEGKILQQDDRALNDPPTREKVADALKDFLGDIEQIPPLLQRHPRQRQKAI